MAIAATSVVPKVTGLDRFHCNAVIKYKKPSLCLRES